jgi:hypothetical protein
MPHEPEPSTRVTLGAIYNQLLVMDKKLDPIPQQVIDHEIRIRAIEKYLWIWIGSAGAVGAGAGQIINTLINP